MTESSSADDDLTDFLRARGSPEWLVQGGIRVLLDRWRLTAEEVKCGYQGDLDEYLNQMDLRQILHEFRLHQRSRGRQISAAERETDSTLRPLLIAARGCLWGQANAAKHGWTPAGNWWYFTHPRHMGEALRQDLSRRHLLADAQTR